LETRPNPCKTPPEKYTPHIHAPQVTKNAIFSIYPKIAIFKNVKNLHYPKIAIFKNVKNQYFGVPQKIRYFQNLNISDFFAV